MDRAKATFQEVISVEMDAQTPGSGGASVGGPWAVASKNFSRIGGCLTVPLIILSCFVMRRDLIYSSIKSPIESRAKHSND